MAKNSSKQTHSPPNKQIRLVYKPFTPLMLFLEKSLALNPFFPETYKRRKLMPAISHFNDFYNCQNEIFLDIDREIFCGKSGTGTKFLGPVPFPSRSKIMRARPDRFSPIYYLQYSSMYHFLKQQCFKRWKVDLILIRDRVPQWKILWLAKHITQKILEKYMHFHTSTSAVKAWLY